MIAKILFRPVKTSLPLKQGALLGTISIPRVNDIFRNFRTWKRYKGGMQQDMWTYSFRTKQAERITDYDGTDTFPMWGEIRSIGPPIAVRSSG